MYPYSSLPPAPSTSGSPCSFKPCPASAGTACVGWEAEGGRVFGGVVAGTEVEEWARGASWGPGTGVGFSGLRETLSVFNSCTCWGNNKGAVSDSERMAASCEHCWQDADIPPWGWRCLSQLDLWWERQRDVFKLILQQTFSISGEFDSHISTQVSNQYVLLATDHIYKDLLQNIRPKQNLQASSFARMKLKH